MSLRRNSCLARSTVNTVRQVDYVLLMSPFHVNPLALEVVLASEACFPVRSYQKPGSKASLFALGVGINAVTPVGVLFDFDNS